MQNSPHRYRKSGFSGDDSIPTSRVRQLGEHWVLAGDAANHSERHAENCRVTLRLLVWFLERENLPELNREAIRLFISYARHGHTEPGGRWGNPRYTKPLAGSSIASYWIHLHAFCAWLEEEEFVAISPMHRMKAPEKRKDEKVIVPFEPEQCRKLIDAAKKSRNAYRDEAMLLVLLDCGLRASELAGLLVGDLNLEAGCLTVRGKGDKRRTVPFQLRVTRAVYRYLSERENGGCPYEPVFIGQRGGGLSRSAVLQMCERLGEVAGIPEVHPHRFRHTAAISFLRAGANLFELQLMLGHEDLKMCRRYAKLAETDLAKSHRRHSPAEYLLGRKR